jgi:outer membrane protein insertion porin family
MMPLVPVRAILACLALLVLLLAPPADAQVSPFNPEGKVIREIAFEGIVRTPETRLRERILTKVGDRYRREAVDEDLKDLFRTGLFDGDIVVEARPIPNDPDGVQLVFLVRERERVVGVRYEGLDAFREKDITDGEGIERAQIRAGAVYDPYKVLLDRQLILSKLRAKGKFFAEVDDERRPVPEGVEVIFNIREGPTVRVEAVEFMGNNHLEPKLLKRVMRQQETFGYFIRPGYFDRAALEEDLETLAQLHRGHGFLDVRVILEDIRFSLDREDVFITIRIIEGPRYKVRSIEVTGTKIVTAAEVEAKLTLKEDGFFDGFALRKDLKTISQVYYNRGYIYADVRYTPRLIGAGNVVDLLFEVTEGDEIFVERIDIQGNTKTREDVIRRELSLFPGEPFNSAEMDESRQRLGRRGYFKDIQIAFEPGTARNQRDLMIRVEEGETGQILFGGGISTSVGLFGRIVFIQRNFDITDVPTSLDDILEGHVFTGAGQTLVIQIEPGRQRSRYRISFTEPFFLPRVFGRYPIQLRTAFSYFDSITARSYEEQQIEGELGLGYRLTRDSLLELSYRLARVTIFSIDSDAPTDVLEVAGDNYVSAVRLSFNVDRNVIDQNFVAYDGYGFGVYTEVAGTAFGGDHDFVRAEANANWQMTLFEFPGTSKHVFGVRGIAGIMEEIGRSDDTPIFERFYAGGPRTIRGFEFRSVGPQEDDEPIGGELRLVASIEYGFPIIPGFDETYSPDFRGDFLRGVLFCDLGSVSRQADEVFDEDFRLAVGVGLRVKLPVFPAPIALDFGFPLIRNDEDDPEVFSFTVGAGLP